MSLTRRRVLTMLGAVSSWPTLAYARPVGSPTAEAQRYTALLRQLMGNSPLAQALGRVYRARYSAEADANTLTWLIMRDLRSIDVPCASGECDASQLLAALNARIRSQFGAGETLSIHGWILARMEARLCALCD